MRLFSALLVYFFQFVLLRLLRPTRHSWLIRNKVLAALQLIVHGDCSTHFGIQGLAIVVIGAQMCGSSLRCATPPLQFILICVNLWCSFGTIWNLEFLQSTTSHSSHSAQELVLAHVGNKVDHFMVKDETNRKNKIGRTNKVRKETPVSPSIQFSLGRMVETLVSAISLPSLESCHQASVETERGEPATSIVATTCFFWKRRSAKRC